MNFGKLIHRNANYRNVWLNLGVRLASNSSCDSNRLTLVEEANGVRNITLNNSKTRNTLSLEMINSLHNDIIEDQDNVKLRCIVLSAVGPVFSAGHNLKELTCENGAAYQLEVFSGCSKLIKAIQSSPVPVIAKVDGLAAAAGCQLVASCDIVVCTDKSSFSTPGASFGVFCSTPGIAVGRTMSRTKSLYMLLTGMPVSAEYAYQAGLVSVVTTSEKLNEEVDKIVHAITSKSRCVLELGKSFFNEQIEMTVDEAYRHGEKKMVENLSLNDGQEGVNSFVEKRKPKWSHN